MIDLYFWTTPNGYKPLLFLEEARLPYRLSPVNISKGEQFHREFAKLSPNMRIPAILDHQPKDSGKPISLFESGAILLYLAQKTDLFFPQAPNQRAEVLQWLFWQMGGLGPMLGQNLHFSQYAPEKLPYAIDRYRNETGRLFSVMNQRLGDREYIAGEYSIADMACYPWIAIHPRLGQNLADFPNLLHWLNRIQQRPAVQQAYKLGEEINTIPTITEESKKYLLGKTADSVAA